MTRPKIVYLDTVRDLARALIAALPRPTAVVGIGNTLRGDDGFGPAVASAIRPSPALHRFDAKDAPENFLGPIADSPCRGVLFIDAADLGAQPGRLALVPPQRLADVHVSTHAISLGLLAESIRQWRRRDRRAEARCAMLAAQPLRLDRPDRLSPPLEAAVRRAVEAIDIFAAEPPAKKHDDP